MRGRLKIQIAEAVNGEVFFQSKRMRFAITDKAVALPPPVEHSHQRTCRFYLRSRVVSG